MVEAKIASGLYTSASDVVREALRLMEQQDQLKVVKLGALRADIQEDLSSGESTPWSADEIKQDGRKRKASRDTAAPGRVTPGGDCSPAPCQGGSRFNLGVHIADDSDDQADAFIDMLDQKVQLLAAQSGLGRRLKSWRTGCAASRSAITSSSITPLRAEF